MSMKMTRESFDQLIAENIGWLVKNSPDCLERNHIVSVLGCASESHYGRQSEIDRLTRELAEARETLQFVERWANHHGVKPHVTPAEALGVIQHHPAIVEITDSYADGKRPTTRNPYAELAEAKARAVIPDGWVAVPVEAPSEVLSAMANATWLTDGSHIEMARRWNGAISAVAEFSARPALPTKGESKNVD